MSMTENEAKKWIRAISATQKESIHTSSLEIRKEALYMAIQALEKVQAFEAIGTIEEFKALKEKNTPKELAEHNFQDEVHHYLCPRCRSIVSYNQNYCEECGQALET